MNKPKRQKIREAIKFVKLRNLSSKPLTVNAGDNFCQGIFEKYYLTDDDDVTDDRKGGIGSTTR